MKIERAVSPTIPAPSPKKDKAPAEKTAVKEPPKASDNVSMRSKMIQWFARVGLGNSPDKGEPGSLTKRTNRHQVAKSQRRLLNLEAISELALQFCLEQGKPEELDPDWFFNFVELAETIHSPAMQELWAKIFSVEISRPGTFSLKSLQTLKQLTQKDAKIFKLAVSMASTRKGDYSPCLIYGFYQKPGLLSFLGLQAPQQINLAQHGLGYPDILSLMDLGLIYSSEIESGEWDPSVRSQWRCGNHTFHLAANKKGLALNYYKFTATGAELSKLVPGSPATSYLEALKHTLSKGFEVT